MMKTETEIAPLFKVRSVMACLSEGFRLLGRNILYLIRFMWLSLLVVVLLNTFTVVLFPRMHQGTPASLIFFFLLCGIQSLFLAVVSCLLYGQVSTYMQKYAELGYFPRIAFGAQWKTIVKNALRIFVMFLLYGLLLVLILAICIGSAWLLAHAFPTYRKWVVMALSLVWLLLSLPFFYAGVYHIMDGSSLFGCIGKGFRAYGSVFAILLVGGIFMLIIMLIAGAPMTVLQLAQMQSDTALLQGDVSDLPGYFSIAQFLSTFIFMLVEQFCIFGLIFSLMFLYGSRTTRQREKARYEAEQRTLNGKI